MNADVDALNELFTSGVTDLLGDLVMIVAIVAVMLWKDSRLTLVTLLTVPMLFVATNWFRYAVTADGQRFITVASLGGDVLAPTTVVVHWTAGLKR